MKAIEFFSSSGGLSKHINNWLKEEMHCEIITIEYAVNTNSNGETVHSALIIYEEN